MSKAKVTEEHLNEAIVLLLRRVTKRIKKRKGKPYANRHEAYGKITEEYNELGDAIRSEDHSDIKSEILDVAESCIYTIASKLAKTEKKNKKRKLKWDLISLKGK